MALCLYHVSCILQASLHAGLDLKQSVDLPPGEDANDWIAVHGEQARVLCCTVMM